MLKKQHEEDGTVKGQYGPVTASASAGNGVAGAAAILLVWAIGLTGVEIPSEVAAAIAVLLGGIGTLIGGRAVRGRPAGRHRATAAEPGPDLLG